MDTLLEQLGRHPLVAAGVLALAVLVVYALVRRLVVFALFLLLVLAGALVWFRLVGYDMPSGLDTLGRTVGKAVEAAGDKGADLLETD